VWKNRGVTPLLIEERKSERGDCTQRRTSALKIDKCSLSDSAQQLKAPSGKSAYGGIEPQQTGAEAGRSSKFRNLLSLLNISSSEVPSRTGPKGRGRLKQHGGRNSVSPGREEQMCAGAKRMSPKSWELITHVGALVRQKMSDRTFHRDKHTVEGLCS